MIGGYPIGSRAVAASRRVAAASGANQAAVSAVEAVDTLAATAGAVIAATVTATEALDTLAASAGPVGGPNSANVTTVEAADVAAGAAGPINDNLTGRAVRRSKRRRVLDVASGADGAALASGEAPATTVGVSAPVAVPAVPAVPELRAIEPVSEGPHDRAIAALLANARQLAAAAVAKRADLSFEAALSDVMAQIDEDETELLLLLA